MPEPALTSPEPSSGPHSTHRERRSRGPRGPRNQAERRPAHPIVYPPSLPVSVRREEIMEAIETHQIVVVAGETGSGKTTQIPKMLLELQRRKVLGRGLIGHTQPRRLAARSVAERIATELESKLGQVVGYQVRFNAQVSGQTRIKLMTDGILLAEIAADPLLKKYDALIIDEAHERSLNIDFILGYLSRIARERPELKIIITSATIDTERFAKHFAQAIKAEVPVIEVSGRTFPVEIRYRPLEGAPTEGDGADLEDGAERRAQSSLEEERDPTDAIVSAVRELSGEGAGDILVFLSGEREIRDTQDALTQEIEHNPRLRGTEVLALYGRLSLGEQQRVFAPSGSRRIVLATNVAETSLTVPGIKYVIDPGTARISRYSHRTKVQRLPIERISQASANQRAGRAGRTSEGIAIRLYSPEDFAERREFTEPEVLRTSLASVILKMLSMGIANSPAEILNFPFLEAPDVKAVNDGVNLLRELGALEESSSPAGAGSKVTTLSAIGSQMAALPVDPRLARMIVEANKRGVVNEVLTLAAALSIQDPRELPSTERPSERAKAQELHQRFKDDKSDFSSFLLLYRYLQIKQKELSSSQFRKLCHREFINYLRVREWQDLIVQLGQLAESVGIRFSAQELDPAGKEDDIHRSVLAGLLANMGNYDQRKRDYIGTRNSRFAIFPGSGLFKKNPDWVMAAELVETSRLWARTVAVIQPEWAEELAPDLIKRTISEPHWSAKMGAAMAYEKVTLFGLTLIPARRVQYSRLDPAGAREMFIRRALVEGDWRTHHRFFHRNLKKLAEVEELQTRMRRYDLLVDDQTLFDFYDSRIGKNVTSERHFDKWFKHASHTDPHLLDFDPQDLLNERAEDLDHEAYPTTWPVGSFDLNLDYEFSPDRANPSPSDGVTVNIPILFLNQVDPAPFKWQIPGLRQELVTALIRSLPKPIRKNVVPAPEVAKQVMPLLNEDADPQKEDFETSLELALRRLRGVVVPPGSWNWEQVPVHLKPHFRIVDERGDILGESQDLAALREELTPALRTAIAQSLGATPKTISAKSGASGQGKTSGAQQGSSTPAGEQGTLSTATPQGALDPNLTQSGLLRWPDADIPTEISRTVQGHTVTGYPALVDAGESVAVNIFDSPEAQQQFMRRGIIRLLALTIPSPEKYVREHLKTSEKLIFTQNPHGSVETLLQDVVLAAIDSLVPEQLPFTAKHFTELRETVRAELVERMFSVAALVADILERQVALQSAFENNRSDTLIGAVNDMRSQLGLLVFNGFVSTVGYQRLARLPRYLQAMRERLAKAPAHPSRDAENMRTVQDLEDEYDDAVAALRAGSRIPASLENVRWLLEELRVSFFAQELGTAQSVSPKRVRRALHEALSKVGNTL